MKYSRVLGIICAITLGIGGCQKNPETSIVKNKNMESLIEEAKHQDKDTAEMKEMKNYETYQKSFTDKKLGVTIEANAKVDVPETEDMSVARVKRVDISQKFLERVKEVLLKDEILYDGSLTYLRTKDMIQKEIEDWEEEIKTYEGDEEDFQRDKEEIKHKIRELKKEYKKAPKKIEVKGHESDGKIHAVKDLLKNEPDNPFYQWEKSLSEDTEVYYGITDGENGKYSSLFVQNNEEYGSVLRYHAGKHGYEFIESAIIEGTEFGEYVDIEGRKEWKDESATISLEKAKEIADSFVKKIGLSQFKFYEGALLEEVADTRGKMGVSEERGYRKVYVLRYMRQIDGTSVTYDSAGKYSEGYEEEKFQKLCWNVECAEVRVNDDGIVGFSYNAPVEVLDTVVENTSLKSFEAIKKIFEKMAPVVSARQSDDEAIKQVLKINRVILGYTRISEKDSFYTGLLVPTWDFRGTIEWEGKEVEPEQSILTINAIDGSVINRTLGY